MGSCGDLTGSETRLWSLIAERARVKGDRSSFDQRIWDLFGEDWAVMFTDLEGFSRQTEAFGIVHFLQIIYEQQELLLPIVREYDGILVKGEADSFLIIFKRAGRALTCAVAMQQACADYDRHRPPEEQIQLCIGIGYGRILKIGDRDIYGREVNAASKLGEDCASAWEILVTDAARAAAVECPDLCFARTDLTVAGSDVNWRLEYSTGATPPA